MFLTTLCRHRFRPHTRLLIKRAPFSRGSYTPLLRAHLRPSATPHGHSRANFAGTMSTLLLHSAPSPSFPAPVSGDEQFLLQAFTSFADAAGSLERSYSLLRAEVGRLRQELEESNGGLARSLEENRTMRQHLDRILEGLPCGVLVVADNGEISRVNPEGRRLLGWGSGGNAESFPQPTSVSSLGTELGELLNRARTENGEQEQRVSQTDSSAPGPEVPEKERWLAVRHAAVPEGAPRSSVFILRDISERKRLEQAEQKLQREQALAEMSAVLAHEIRNPLGSLELFAGLLAEVELSPECGSGWNTCRRECAAWPRP